MIFAPVKEVRVYRNGAVVRRGAAVALRAGTNEVLLSGIGAGADPDSLRLFFPAGVVGADVQILPYAEAVDRLPSQDKAEEIAALESRLQTLKTMEELWIANGNFTARGDCPAETVERYLRALPENLDALRAQQNALGRELAEMKKQLETLQGKEAMRIVRLVLESAEEIEVPFEMEYADNSARWISMYEIHAAADADRLKVVSRARITQNSGEDWENVRVALYTGNPTARQEIPTLKKRSLRFRPEPGANGGMMRSMPMPAGAAAPAGMMGMAMAMAAPMQNMAMEAAAEEEADTMTCFTLPGTRTVVSGSTGTVADLKTDEVPADIRVVCVPQLDDGAYLAAMVKTAEWPLKPSSAKIYLNGNYCGEVRVSPDATEEEFSISLGKDERVAVTREEIRAKTEDVLLKGQKRKLCEYRIRVANNREKPLAVRVMDSIPVSTEKQITVDRVETDGADLNADTGKLSWNLTVPGRASVEKRLSYAVTYPRDKVLQEIRSDGKGGRFCPKCGAKAPGRFCPECGGVVD